jgi:hypothetical protein
MIFIETSVFSLLLLMYSKNEQDDLTPEQKRIHRTLVQAELGQSAGER